MRHEDLRWLCWLRHLHIYNRGSSFTWILSALPTSVEGTSRSCWLAVGCLGTRRYSRGTRPFCRHRARGCHRNGGGLVKLQAAFYERHGWRGFPNTANRLIAEARSAGLLVIVDAKRGDVGSTNIACAEAISGTDAPLGSRCAHRPPLPRSPAPWMASFPAPTKQGAVCSSWTRSSNPEGRVVQSATRSRWTVRSKKRYWWTIGELECQTGTRRDRTDRSGRWTHAHVSHTRPCDSPRTPPGSGRRRAGGRR